MPTPTPAKITSSFQKIHTKLGAYSKSINFVKFGVTQVSDWAEQDHLADEITTPTYPVIVHDKPDANLAIYFEGGIGADQKVFVVLPHSIVDKLPYDTLGQRAEQFLLERVGSSRGGIYYGDDLYTIETTPFAKNILGTVVTQYVVVGTAVKKATLPL